jgi:hypothetical protein
MPEDIHESLWTRVKAVIERGEIGVTREIYDEMTHITGSVGECIRANEDALLLELGQSVWDFTLYIEHSQRMLIQHRDFISEFCGGSKKTVGVNDVSIVCLGQTLKIPVISSEKPCAQMPNAKKRHIPDICGAESVLHMTFNDFLRAEGIKI